VTWVTVTAKRISQLAAKIQIHTYIDTHTRTHTNRDRDLGPLGMIWRWIVPIRIQC